MELKLTFEEFCALAVRELDYPKSDKPLRFVKEYSHEGEGECYEMPAYVYIDIIKPSAK